MDEKVPRKGNGGKYIVIDIANSVNGVWVSPKPLPCIKQ